MFLRHESKSGVAEYDQRFAVGFAEAILHVRNQRIGREKRSGNFHRRRPLDGLHGSPQMAVVVSQVAVPSSAGPRLDLHGQWFAFGRFIVRTHLLEQGVERGAERRADTDFLVDVQREVFDGLYGFGQDFSLD